MCPSQFIDREDKRTTFEPEYREGFEQFIAQVLRPKFIDKIRISTVHEAFCVFLACTILIAFGFAASNIGEKV